MGVCVGGGGGGEGGCGGRRVERYVCVEEGGG